jgi:hypothetical protein
VAVLAGCTSAHPTGGSVSTPPSTVPASTPPTTRAVPRTTAYAPTHLQTTPDAAAEALITAWETGNRSSAAAGASPAAVATMFAQPYAAGSVQARGCTASTDNPGTCTYANRQSGSLYEIAVTKVAAGWYVSSVTVES